MSDPVDKVNRLLALTQSDNLDEARNAALAAARLIRAYGLILTMPPTGGTVSFPAPRMRTQVVTRPIRTRMERKPQENGWRKVKAKFDGACKWCGKTIKKDSQIYWCPDEGALHPSCYNETK